MPRCLEALPKGACGGERAGGEVTARLPSSHSRKGARCRAGNAKRERGGGDDDDDGSVGDGMAPPVEPPADEGSTHCPLWDRNVTKISAVPTGLLRKALMAAEPVAFSAANLKSVAKKGSREPPAAYILQCVEFITGLDAGSHIDFKYHSPVAFTEWIRDLNKSFGRRARDLNVLASCDSWEEHGVYSISRSSKAGLVLARNFKNMSVTLPVKATGVVSLDYNFSETKAVVQDTGSSQPMVCMAYFPSAGVHQLQAHDPKVKTRATGHSNAKVKQEACAEEDDAMAAPVGLVKPPLATKAPRQAAGSGKAGARDGGNVAKKRQQTGLFGKPAQPPKCPATGSIQGASKVPRKKMTT